MKKKSSFIETISKSRLELQHDIVQTPSIFYFLLELAIIKKVFCDSFIKHIIVLFTK